MKRSALVLALVIGCAGLASADEALFENLPGRLSDMESGFSPALAVPLVGEDRAGIHLRLWMASLEGELDVDGTVLSGTEVDLADDLDFGDNEFIPEWSAWVRLPVSGAIRASFWQHEFEASETLTQTFNFADSTYVAGVAVDSSLEVTSLSAMYEYPLLSPGLLGTHTEVGVQAGLQ